MIIGTFFDVRQKLYRPRAGVIAQIFVSLPPTGNSITTPALAFDVADGWVTGQNPPKLQWTLPLDGSVQVGDWIGREYATNSGFTGSMTEWHQLTSNDVLGGVMTFPFATAPATGLTYFRPYSAHGAGPGSFTLISSPGTAISDTLASNVSTTKFLNGTNASVDQSPYMTVTSNLIVTCNAGVGATTYTRADHSVPTAAKYEITISAINSTNAFGFGMCDRSIPLGPGALYPVPGKQGEGAGFTLQMYPGSTTTYLQMNNVSGAGATLLTTPSNNSVGDIWAIERNGSAITIKCKQGGTVTTFGPYTLTASIPTDWTAFVGANFTSQQMTMNFGATAFAISSALSGW